MAKVVLENLYKTYPGKKGREVSAVKDVCRRAGCGEVTVGVRTFFR